MYLYLIALLLRTLALRQTDRFKKLLLYKFETYHIFLFDILIISPKKITKVKISLQLELLLS